MFPPFEVAYIRRADPDLNDLETLRFDVAFNRPVTGVSADDFAIDAPASKDVSGAAVLGVSGSGMHYTVTVARGTGDGLLSTDLIDDDSIRLDGGSQMPLTCTINEPTSLRAALDAPDPVGPGGCACQDKRLSVTDAFTYMLAGLILLALRRRWEP